MTDDIDKRDAGEIFKIDAAQRRVYGWASVARKADGSLPVDADGDVIDTPEAVRAWENSFYEFFFDAARTMDDMHVDFGVAKRITGIVLTDDLKAAMGVPDGILPTAALIVVDIPKTERGDALWADIVAGKRKMLSIVARVAREELTDAA